MIATITRSGLEAAVETAAQATIDVVMVVAIAASIAEPFLLARFYS